MSPVHPEADSETAEVNECALQSKSGDPGARLVQYLQPGPYQFAWVNSAIRLKGAEKAPLRLSFKLCEQTWASWRVRCHQHHRGRTLAMSTPRARCRAAQAPARNRACFRGDHDWWLGPMRVHHSGYFQKRRAARDPGWIRPSRSIHAHSSLAAVPRGLAQGRSCRRRIPGRGALYG